MHWREQSVAERVRLLVTCALVTFLTVSCSSTKHSYDKDQTEDMLEKGAVIVRIETIPGRDARQGQVTGVVDAPRERVWKVVTDYNGHKHFMPNILESFAIRSEALELVEKARPEDLPRLENQFVKYMTQDVERPAVFVYGVGDFPWPMPNKRYILKIQQDHERYVTRSTMVIGQMEANEASWELKPYGDGGTRTLATYKVLLDPGMPFPGFAVEMAANSALPEVIKAVRRRVMDPRYERSRGKP